MVKHSLKPEVVAKEATPHLKQIEPEMIRNLRKHLNHMTKFNARLVMSGQVAMTA